MINLIGCSLPDYRSLYRWTLLIGSPRELARHVPLVVGDDGQLVQGDGGDAELAGHQGLLSLPLPSSPRPPCCRSRRAALSR